MCPIRQHLRGCPTLLSHALRHQIDLYESSNHVPFCEHNRNKIWSREWHYGYLRGVGARNIAREFQTFSMMAKIYWISRWQGKKIHKIGRIFYFSAWMRCVYRMSDEYHGVISSRRNVEAYLCTIKGDGKERTRLEDWWEQGWKSVLLKLVRNV